MCLSLTATKSSVLRALLSELKLHIVVGVLDVKSKQGISSNWKECVGKVMAYGAERQKCYNKELIVGLI